MYNVELTSLAESDIEMICDYLLQVNINASVSFSKNLVKALNRLSIFPESGTHCRSKKLEQKGFRVLMLTYDYLLFYGIKNETVLVYRIIHGKMNYTSIL